MYTVDGVQKEKTKIHVIGKVVGIIFYIILIPIIIINFTLIIKSFINPSEIPDFFGFKSFVIVSGSMKPTIMINDAIWIREVPESELNVGDIISFDQDGVVVTHRIVNIILDGNNKKYQTKGDNNNTTDKRLITYDCIEGKFQFKINQLGIIIDILKNKITLILLILVIVLISFYKSNLNTKNKSKKPKNREI